MKQYRFIGDPNDYNWDFELVNGKVYRDDEKPFGQLTINILIDEAKHDLANGNSEAIREHASEFLSDWEEVTNDK